MSRSKPRQDDKNYKTWPCCFPCNCSQVNFISTSGGKQSPLHQHTFSLPKLAPCEAQDSNAQTNLHGSVRKCQFYACKIIYMCSIYNTCITSVRGGIGQRYGLGTEVCLAMWTLQQPLLQKPGELSVQKQKQAQSGTNSKQLSLSFSLLCCSLEYFRLFTTSRHNHISLFPCPRFLGK